MQTAVERAARAAEAAGARVKDLELPPIFDEAGRAQSHRSRTMKRSARSPTNTTIIAIASARSCARSSKRPHRSTSIPTTRHAAPRAARASAGTICLADNEVMLTPSAPGAAPQGLDSTGEPIFNRLWTLLGAPCVNVPGCRRWRLPLGVQIVGRFARDRFALSAAAWLENAIARGKCG